MFTKTRRECIPVGSVAASLLLTVLANMSVSRTLSDRRRNIYIAKVLSLNWFQVREHVDYISQPFGSS